MNRNKIIDFPQGRPVEHDPENFLRFTANDNEAFYIKAKYRDTIIKIIKSLLVVYSEQSEQEKNTG